MLQLTKEMGYPTGIFLAVLLHFTSVTAHYCEWNTCKATETCCGDNICCVSTDFMFDVIAGVSASLALVFLCYSLFFICRYSCRVGCPLLLLMLNNYKNSSSDIESPTANLAANDMQHDAYRYSDPPPPYSEVVQVGR
ncbi:uncharacterized protein LOC105685672 isoform X1 [Athalia rosae]|uniref:uncharacterized protein LOC105685672 isoform X1 n=1 Tax=Athalia rosae TaxID=37344 RepID=UPI0020340A60|nr:uncharacterized protein LOC105685672 isoform X1 [Athalia rosae]